MLRPSFPRKETFAQLVIPAKAGIQPPLPLGEGWGEGRYPQPRDCASPRNAEAQRLPPLHMVERG